MITKINSTVKRADLYKNGAVIYRTFKTHLKEGENLIEVGGLPALYFNERLDLYSNAAVKIIGYNMLKNSISMENELSATVKSLCKEVSDLEVKIDILEKEREFYSERFIKMSTNDSGATSEIAYKTNKEKLQRILEKHSNMSLQRDSLKARISRQTELDTGDKNSCVLSIQVSTEKNCNSEFTAVFTSRNGSIGWTPSYSIDCNKVAGNIKMLLSANVYQNTGEDWKNVELTFFTGEQLNQVKMPEFSPYYFGRDQLFPPVPMARSASFSVPMAMSVSADGERFSDSSSALSEGSSVLTAKRQSAAVLAPLPEAEEYYEVANVTAETDEVSTQYKVKMLTDVFNNAKKVLDLEEKEVLCKFLLECMPAQNCKAMLLAKLRKNILPLSAPALIKMDGKIIGSTYLSGLTDVITLGVDDSVSVKYTEGNRYVSKDSAGNATVTMNHIVKVKSDKRQKSTINIIDRLPVLSDKSLTLEILDISGAKYDKADGKLEWELQLDTKEHELNIKYSIYAKFIKTKIS